MYIPQKRNEYPKLRKSGEKQVEHFLKGLGLPKFELKIVALNFTIKTTWKWVSMYYDVRYVKEVNINHQIPGPLPDCVRGTV
jgi:hypothetical protein